jgi:hypothetical protein
MINSIDNQYEITNPFDDKTTCDFKLLNEKKKTFYIYSNENNIELLNEIKKLNILNSNIFDIFKTEIKHNCCKCVNIILYINTNSENKKLIKYITCIFFSAVNMGFLLKEYILRLYIDQSVLEYCKKNNDFNMIYEYIKKLSNVEIYLINCKIDQAYFKRIYRFLSLIDDEVCINIIREADGFVTNLDCHNIL